MTALEYMEKQAEKCRQNYDRAMARGATIGELVNIQNKTSYYDQAVEALRMPTYNRHEVAEIIAELFGDSCACNFNGIDEWLPEHCELLDACPNTVGVACWEQYLKFRDAKMDGDGNDS